MQDTADHSAIYCPNTQYTVICKYIHSKIFTETNYLIRRCERVKKQSEAAGVFLKARKMNKGMGRLPWWLQRPRQPRRRQQLGLVQCGEAKVHNLIFPHGNSQKYWSFHSRRSRCCQSWRSAIGKENTVVTPKVERVLVKVQTF